MEPLGALSGASGGMADAVSGIIEQRLRQTQVANQMQQAQDTLAETVRKNQADEANRAENTRQLGLYHQGQMADIESRDKQASLDRESAQRLGVLKTLPIGTQVSPDEQSKFTAMGVPAAAFSKYQPPSMGMSTPTGEVGPTAEQPAGQWGGTQTEIEQRIKDARTPSETKTAHDLQLQGILAKPRAQWTPAEQDLVTGQQEFNKMQGAEATNRMNIRLENTGQRTTDRQTQSAIKEQYGIVQKKLDGLKPEQAADLMQSLSAPGGVNDAVAIPKFLSALAGGAGSGLRMTQSELNLIQSARPGIESLGLKLSNLANGYNALTDKQRADMKALVSSIAQRHMKLADMYNEAQGNMIYSSTPEEARMYGNQLNRAETNMYRGLIDTPAGDGPAPPPVAGPAGPNLGEMTSPGGLKFRVAPKQQ